MKSCALVPSPVSYYSQNKTNINDAISTRLVEPPVRIWAFVFFSFFTLVFTNGTLCVLLNKSLVFFRAAPAKQKNIYFFWLVQLPLWNSGCGYPRRLSCCVILPFSFPPHPSFFILFYSLAVYFILYVIGQAGCDSRVAPPPTHCTEIAGPKGHAAPAFFSFSAGSASSFSKWIYI